MKAKAPFQFTSEQLKDFRDVLTAYFLDELDIELSNLQADLFIQFLSEKIGPKFYNVGITDAMQLMKEKSEDLVMLIKE